MRNGLGSTARPRSVDHVEPRPWVITEHVPRMGGTSGASPTEAGLAAQEAIGAAAQPTPKRKRKRKYAPADTGHRLLRLQQWSDRRDLDGAVRAPGSGDT